MLRYFFPRRRQILKYFALVVGLFIILKLFSKSEIPSEEPGLPILVAQRGNDHYFKAKPLLNSEAFSKPARRWELKKRIHSFATDIPYGKLNVHIWEEICGDDLSSLKNHVLFPKFPSRRLFTETTLFTHGMKHYDYGERIFGYLLPTSTAIYEFLVLGKSVEVWFGLKSDPENYKQVYQSSHVKEGVGTFSWELFADNMYYIEILHKKGNEDDEFALKWKISFPHHSKDKYVELSGLDMSAMMLDSYLGNGDVDGNGSHLEIPNIHRQIQFPILDEQEQRRNNLFKLPYISNHVVKNILPSCEYRPSYVVDHTLTNYRGVWETHYNSLYPVDKTNVTRGGWVCLGNDVLKEKEAMQIVAEYMKSLDKKHFGHFKLIRVLSVEKNHDSLRGDRYLLELEIQDTKNRKSYRLSEYVYKKRGQTSLCAPSGYSWSRNATVNIVLTVGGQQGRWVQHFINNLAEIYRMTKDQNLNVIIMDFHSKDIDIEEALKQSGLPRYILLHMKSKFHKTIGLQYAMSIITDPNDIVFVCDLHLYLPVTIVDHLRKHCIQGKTAFNPLLIRLDCGYTASNPNGRWEHDGFGPIATFKSDWDRFGGMNVERFKHTWGGEDWDLVDRILSAGLEIERLKILNFFHFFHSKKGMWKDSE